MTVVGAASGQTTWATVAGQLNCRWAMRTDVGQRREINEDSAVAVAPIFAVADGMGGHDAGEVASGFVADALGKLGGTGLSDESVANALRAAVDELVQSGVDAGSGTTVTGIALRDQDGPQAIDVFNIGDSRVYLFREGTIVQLTKDHSVVQELVDSGQLSPDEAEVHPHSNVITRAVGFHDDPVPDTLRLEIEPGDRLLVCSDGLTKEITLYGLQHFLTEAETVDDAADALVNAAIGNGGRDNVTLIVLQFDRLEDA